ncbi:MAG TPA: 3-oxoacyl-[acyl-carrier-protein] synthase III C-terminal domain-containing protein [Thermoanaerobaculia bacterium]|nr:3-oxoacyl-[acyl-carrier-protein] synthase III C-terminal domain-containing protein [Thermoanaerobaculia bacterium]
MHDAVIAATATAVPDFVVTRDVVKTYFGQVFPLEGSRLDAMMAVVDNSGIRQRFCVLPVEELIQPRSLDRISEQYQEHAIRLGRTVAAECLERARMRPEDIDLIVTVSCTGVMIPSLDAHLVNAMGFRSNVRRLPITELGCAAGASAIARGRDFLLAFPKGRVLIVAVELASLTFQRGSLSQANLISSILFGDGAAAAIMTGADAPGPRVLDAESYLFPDSIDAMGFVLKESGLHIVLSRDVPDMIRGRIRELVHCFLARNRVAPGDIGAFVLHPGGRKLLAAIEEELALPRGRTQPSWDVLAEYGNLSSASVLFVLHEWLTRSRPAPGSLGLMAAFGPGFTAEQLLLQWA